VDRDGYVTEGSSSTAWIVTEDGALVTRPNGTGILPGVTRMTTTDVAQRLGIPIEERKFTVVEAKAAREAFITAASMIVMPVVSIDGHAVGGGQPGPLSQRLREEFHRFAHVS
jgi:D-alanine transaminase